MRLVGLVLFGGAMFGLGVLSASWLILVAAFGRTQDDSA